MRKFSIINEIGQEYSLNDLNTGLFKNINGIGFDKAYAYVRNGNRWVRNKMEPKQVPLTGNIVTASVDPYAGEAQLISFLRSSAELRIKYQTTQGTWYKNVDLVSYGKSEIQRVALICPVTFMPRSQWYTTASVSPAVNPEEEDEKYYNNEYAYDYSYNENSSAELNVTNHSSLDAEWSAVIEGPVQNPTITVTNNGKVIGEVDITAVCVEGESIEYSCLDGENGMFCVLHSLDGDVNLVEDFDIEKTNWFYLKPGVNTIVFDVGGLLQAPITVTVNESYEVV